MTEIEKTFIAGDYHIGQFIFRMKPNPNPGLNPKILHVICYMQLFHEYILLCRQWCLGRQISHPENQNSKHHRNKSQEFPISSLYLDGIHRKVSCYNPNFMEKSLFKRNNSTFSLCFVLVLPSKLIAEFQCSVLTGLHYIYCYEDLL